jgi:hypothetical protein
MPWRMDSTVGAHVWDTEPMTRDELAQRDEEIVWLKNHERRNWKLINGRIAGSGDPTMLEGTYGGLVAYPPAQDLTAVTGGTANVAWWTPALYTPLPANSVLSPEAYRIAATGRVTSSATTQTITPNANIGTAIGTGLGAGAAMSLGSATAVTNMLWFMLGDVTIRAAGSAGVAIGSFVLKITNAAGASTSIIQEIFGGAATQTAIDFTAAQGLALGATPSAAGVSVTPTQVHWMSWNLQDPEEERDIEDLKGADHNPFGDPFEVMA